MGLDSRKLETERSRQDRAARRRAQRPAHRADRRVRPGRRLLRADRPRIGRMQQAAGNLPAIESDLARESDRCCPTVQSTSRPHPPVSARKTPPRTENPDNPKPASASPSRTLLTAGNGFEHQRLRMAGLRSSRHWRGQLCYVRRPHSGARYVSCSSDEHLRRRICSVLVSRRL
jgi:hypothetical protein